MTSGVSPTPGDDGPRTGSDDPVPSPSLMAAVRDVLSAWQAQDGTMRDDFPWLHQYEDGAANGLDVSYELRKFWRVGLYIGPKHWQKEGLTPSDLESVDDSDREQWDGWLGSMFNTRAEAIDWALAR